MKVLAPIAIRQNGGCVGLITGFLFVENPANRRAAAKRLKKIGRYLRDLFPFRRTRLTHQCRPVTINGNCAER